MATFIDTHNIDKSYKTCPYDPTHRIPAHRMPIHLVKCSAKSDQKLRSCPFNASHRLPKHLFSDHLKTCEDNRNIINTEASTYRRVWQPNVTIEPFVVNNTVVPSEENWDES